MKKVKETKWICDFCGKDFNKKKDCETHEHIVHNNEKSAIKVTASLDGHTASWSWREEPVWVNADQFMLNVLKDTSVAGLFSWYCYCDPGMKNVEQARRVIKDCAKEYLNTAVATLCKPLDAECIMRIV